MSFDESLRRVTNNIEDSLGIAMVGMDGIVVEEHKKDPLLDLQSLGAEYCAVIKDIERASSSLGLGSSKEISVITDKTIIVLNRINEDYFLLLVLGSEGNFGKGRFLLKREIAFIEKEL